MTKTSDTRTFQRETERGERSEIGREGWAEQSSSPSRDAILLVLI